jgi:hypothetical protein
MTLNEKGKPTIFIWDDFCEKQIYKINSYPIETIIDFDNLIEEVKDY